MRLKNSLVLHVVDTHIVFQSATNSRGKFTTHLWNVFVECWNMLYVDYPKILRLDQEAGFGASSFKELANAHEIKLKFSGAQSQYFS